MFSAVVLGVYINDELDKKSDAVSYAKNANCMILGGAGCNVDVVDEK